MSPSASQGDSAPSPGSQPYAATESTPPAPTGSRSDGRPIIIALVVLLLIVHQDNWFWTDDRLVFGFLPIGLFWHICISIAAAATWALATKIAWPMAEDSADSAGGEGGQ